MLQKKHIVNVFNACLLRRFTCHPLPSRLSSATTTSGREALLHIISPNFSSFRLQLFVVFHLFSLHHEQLTRRHSPFSGCGCFGAHFHIAIATICGAVPNCWMNYTGILIFWLLSHSRSCTNSWVVQVLDYRTTDVDASYMEETQPSMILYDLELYWPRH